jgi:hypothetical protein
MSTWIPSVLAATATALPSATYTALGVVEDAAYSGLKPTREGMEVANISTSVENDDWVLIVDACILVSIFGSPLGFCA